MRVVIAGCGYVGTALGLGLAAAGHEVFGLRRDPSGLPAGIVPVAADLVSGSGLAALPAGIDACVAAISPDRRAEGAYEDAYVRALRNLRSELEVKGSRRLHWMFTSSTAVYGDLGGAWIDEATSTDPSGFAGRAILRGEALVREADAGATVVRLGGIYGPGRTRLLDQVRRGEAVIPAAPVYTNRIHRDDAAGALQHLLEIDDPEPVYLGVDHEPAERAVVLGWLAERLGAPSPPRGDEATTTRGNKRARNDRLVAAGYRFRYPTFREGYEAIIGAAGDRGGAP